MSIWDDTRADWNARDGDPMHTAQPEERTAFVEHYDGGHPLGLDKLEHAACLAKVRQFQDFHIDGRGWSDLGYNGLICPCGRAIEGRGLGYVGAHCPGYNRTGWGIQFMLGGDEEPTEAAKARMVRLRDDLNDLAGRDLQVMGHRDGFNTECPGEHVYAWILAGMPLNGTGGAQDGPAPTIPQRPAPGFTPVWTPTGKMSVKQIQAAAGVVQDGLYGPATAAAVKQLQVELGVTPDGYWGKRTEAAHKAGQRGRLVVDGVRGPATHKALQEWAGATPDGIWGPATRRALQAKLRVTVDGSVGPITVKALQAEVGASVDGVWGPATTRALQRYLNGVLS